MRSIRIPCKQRSVGPIIDRLELVIRIDRSSIVVGKSHCGCPVPILNPPDFGWAVRLAQSFWPTDFVGAFPSDPGIVFPRVLTTSSILGKGHLWAVNRQACAPGMCVARACVAVWSGVAMPVMDTRTGLRGQRDRAIAGPVAGADSGDLARSRVYRHALREPGVATRSTPGRPLDPIPIFTYNSQAAKANAGRGYGIAELFNPTIQRLGTVASLITGTGKTLVYSDVFVDSWSVAPASARNGLMLLSDGSYVERQPDGLRWLYNAAGMAWRIQSPSGNVWDIQRNSDCLISAITGPGGRVTTNSGTGGTFAVTQPGSRITTFSLTVANAWSKSNMPMVRRLD